MLTAFVVNVFQAPTGFVFSAESKTPNGIAQIFLSWVLRDLCVIRGKYGK